VIVFSVLKDIMNMRLALGRYQGIMDAVSSDAEVKEQMLKLREQVHEEMLTAGVEIWNGLWYGLMVSSWIWAFVLFDTLSSSVGVREGLWVLIVMIVSPFVLHGIGLEIASYLFDDETLRKRRTGIHSLRSLSLASISSRRRLSIRPLSFRVSKLDDEFDGECIEMKAQETKSPLATMSDEHGV
jgi:hypothetical protein